MRTDHVVGFDAEAVQYIEDHGGRGRLTVRAAYNDTDLILGLLIEVLGEGVYLDAQLTCADQFGIVLASVHTQDDGIDV